MESGFSADHPYLVEAKRNLQLMIAGLELLDTVEQKGAAMDKLPFEDMEVPIPEVQPALIGRAEVIRCCAGAARGAGRRRRGGHTW